MGKRLYIVAAAALAFSTASLASADSFSAGFTGPGGVSGLFTLTGIDEGGGEFLITSGSGTFDDGAVDDPVTLIANLNGPENSSLSPSGDFTYDDLLFPGSGPDQFLTVNGLLFSFDGVELNIWQLGSGPGTDGWDESIDGVVSGGTGTFISSPLPASPVPEPDTWVPVTGALIVMLTMLHTRAAARRRRCGRGAKQGAPRLWWPPLR